ncbi:MAG: YceI family protein [Vicinamibacteria bacterium]
MIRRSLLMIAVLALAAGAASAQDTWVVDKPHSEVSFQVRHFVTKVRGRFTEFTGTVVTHAAKPEASSVEFAISSASIDTGNEGRDKHLRSADFFDVERFPEISFRSAAVKPLGKDLYEVKGTLILHGVSREITLLVNFAGTMVTKGRDGKESAKAGFSIETTIDRKDFGIVWNRALDTGGAMLGDEVQVSINLEMNKAEPQGR